MAITITNFNPQTRSITFTADGQSFTKTGLGTFASEKELIEWCESIARTEASAEPTIGVDIASLLNTPISSADLPSPQPSLDPEA